jgi:L-rhamnose mutarotase
MSSIAPVAEPLETVAFRMKLFPGNADEYRRRHDAIWPELVDALHAAGVSYYRIFLDEATNCLFAILKRRRDHTMDRLPQTDVVRRWWAMMSDIMETNPDQSPVEQPLAPMFSME